MIARYLAYLVPIVMIGTTPSYAATLRAVTELHTDVVYLSDLFDGVDHDRSIGPSPNVGERLLIEAPQLNAIARQFGVDWHSVSPGERVLLNRPGSPFTREQAMDVLRPALEVAGVSNDANVELEGYTPPIVSPGDAVTGSIEELDYDATSGRFTAVLTVEARKSQLSHTRITGRVQEMISLPVATHRLLPGDVVSETDVKMKRLIANIVQGEVAVTPAQLIGMEVHKSISPGVPFETADFGRPAAVRKGQIVHIQLEYPGLLISAQGVAAESGALGDRVKVANATSRTTLDTQVTGMGQVRLATSAPVYKTTYNRLPPSEVKP